MKVAIFVGVNKKRLTGFFIAADNLRKGLERLGHKVAFVCPTVQDKKEGVYKYRSPLGVWALPNIIDRSVFARIDKFKPDIVHSHGADIVGIAGIKYAFDKHLPIVFTAHNEFRAFLKLSFPWYLRFWLAPLLLRWILVYIKLCDVIVALNSNIKAYLQREGVKGKIVVQPTGVELERFRYKPRPLPNGQIVILCVATMDKRKNVRLLVNMMRHLSKERFRLNLVGEGPDKAKLENLAVRLGLENIKFYGRIPYKYMHKYYHEADIFALASSAEAQPLVYVEAMAGGLPIVTMDNLGSRHAVKHLQTGLIMRKADPKLFAQAIKKIVKGKRLYKEMSKRAFVRAHKFDVIETTKSTVKIYEEAIRYYKKAKSEAKPSKISKMFNKLTGIAGLRNEKRNEVF